MSVGVANLPWVEKYRPQTLDDLISQKEIVRKQLAKLRTLELFDISFYYTMKYVVNDSEMLFN